MSLRMSQARRSSILPALILAAAALGPGAAGAAQPPEVPAGAFAQGAYERGVPRVEARLLVHPDDTATGDGVRLGVLFDLAPGWHLYWRNPGESGLPTRLEWEIAGARVEPVAWPAPSAFTESEGLLTTYGYEGRVLLATRARFHEPAPRERIARVRAELLVCEVECIPASLRLERRLEPAGGESVRALFEQAERSLPRAPAALGLELDARLADAGPGAPGVWLHVRGCDDEPRCASPRPATPAFFPDGRDGGEIEVVETQLDAERGFRVALRARDAAPQRLTGVLAFVDGVGERRAVEVDLELASAPAPASGLAVALLFGLLGGLVLNLMPCVLPVLALKAVAVAELAQLRRGAAFAHGLAYLAGVLASLAALAAAVVALRAAGIAVGWGFQFQEPLFVAAVASVLVVFALNLFGVFEVGVDAGRLAAIGADAAGARRSLFDGLLAVVLATPCSAPFLGTAVGFAFASAAPVILAIFLAIGVGLALPFTLVAAFPGWARRLPRSGPWMAKLREGLGFALLATVVWLLWIAGRAAGEGASMRLLAWLLALGFATWLLAALREAARRARSAGAALALLLLLTTGAGVVRVEPAPRSDAGAVRRYEPDAVLAEQRAGRPVFVYFTADWCITCKVNERVVLADESVRSALDQAGFAVFAADWTRRDERITAELARFGRSGVPLYLLFPADASAPPLRLPELLTRERFLAALRETASATPPVRRVTLSRAQPSILSALSRSTE
jgi:thiol:disulfide interchange protein DsbD